MSCRTPQHRSPGRPPRRRGAVALLLVAALLSCLGLLGLAIELAWLFHVQDQLQGACDAAALAGAAELVDRSVLRPGTPSDPAADFDRACRVAEEVAAENRVGGVAPRLQWHDPPAPDDDLTAGWLDDPSDRRAELVLWPQAEQLNTLRVRGQRSSLRDSAVRLRLSRLLGIDAADVAAEAWASVDHRIYGLRPQPGCAVMVSPLALLSQDGGQGWFDQAGAAAVAGENDRYTVDESTAQVRSRPDGIPELSFRAAIVGSQQAATGTVAVLFFGPPGDAGQQLALRQLERGLTAADLVEFGGELALDDDGQLSAAGADQLEPQWASALEQVRGRPRVWPLYAAPDATSPPPSDAAATFTVVSFGAGSVVAARIDDDGWLNLEVQPTVLVSSQALVRPLREGQRQNPWIVKLALTH